MRPVARNRCVAAQPPRCCAHEIKSKAKPRNPPPAPSHCRAIARAPRAPSRLLYEFRRTLRGWLPTRSVDGAGSHRRGSRGSRARERHPKRRNHPAGPHPRRLRYGRQFSCEQPVHLRHLQAPARAPSDLTSAGRAKHRKRHRRQERQWLARRQKREAAVLAHVQRHGLEVPAIDDAPRTKDVLAALPAEQRESLERAMHRRRIRASMRSATRGPRAVRPQFIRRCMARHGSRPGHHVVSDSRVSPRSGAGRVARRGVGSGGGGSGDDGRSVVLHRHAGCPNTNVRAAVDRDRDEQGARRRRP